MLKFHWRPPQFFKLWNNFLYFSSLTFSVLQPTLRAAYGYLKKHYALEKLLFTFFTSTTFIEGSFFLSLLSKDSRTKWKKQNQHNENKKLLLFTPYCHSENITLSSLLLFSSLASSFSTALKKWKWNYIFIFAALIHTPPIYVKMEDLFSPREWASIFFIEPRLSFMKISQGATLDPTGSIGGESCTVYYKSQNGLEYR